MPQRYSRFLRYLVFNTSTVAIGSSAWPFLNLWQHLPEFRRNAIADTNLTELMHWVFKRVGAGNCPRGDHDNDGYVGLYVSRVRIFFTTTITTGPLPR
jgi:hypothetical protein